MIEADSTPIDLVYDEILRQLMRMEHAEEADTDRAKAIDNATDAVIDMMGKRFNFCVAAGKISMKRDCAVYRSVVAEAFERSIGLSEASYYIECNSLDSPRHYYVSNARNLIQQARNVILYNGMIAAAGLTDDRVSVELMKEVIGRACRKRASFDKTMSALQEASTNIDYIVMLQKSVSLSIPILSPANFNRLGIADSSYTVLKRANKNLLNRIESGYLFSNRMAA